MILHTFTNILVKKFFGNNLVNRFVKYLIKCPYYSHKREYEYIDLNEAIHQKTLDREDNEWKIVIC